MSQKVKISLRKVLRAITSLVVLTACVGAVMGARKYAASIHLKGVTYDISNPDDAQFHSKTSLKQLLLDNTHLNWKNKTVKELNLHRLEKIAKADPWVANANAYVDNRSVLHFQITQRVPQVRIFDGDGQSYYLDSALTPIPLSSRYVAYVPVVSGLPRLKDDSIGRSIKSQVYFVAKAIEKDKFWNAQVAEIIWNKGNDFTLIPNIGQHHIRLGDTAHLTQKLASVYQFYQKVLNRIGWDRYTVVDARFKGQIVASPALPWKPPVDRAMSTMNWVKSVIGDDTSKGVFAGMLMQEPPTAIASDLEIVPSIPMSALNEQWNVQADNIPTLTAEEDSSSAAHAEVRNFKLNTPEPTVKADVVKPIVKKPEPSKKAPVNAPEHSKPASSATKKVVIKESTKKLTESKNPVPEEKTLQSEAKSTPKEPEKPKEKPKPKYILE